VFNMPLVLSRVRYCALFAERGEAIDSKICRCRPLAAAPPRWPAARNHRPAFKLSCPLMGQRRTSKRIGARSVHPRVADIAWLLSQVRLVPLHEVAALQPAAREQEPRGRQPVERTGMAGWQGQRDQLMTASQCPTSRDFVPWRFLDAGQLSLPSVSSLPASKNQHTSGLKRTSTQQRF
jgi:transposase InsO family protein